MNEIVKETYEEQIQSDRWGNSVFKKIELLKLDFSGRVGEIFLMKIITELGLGVTKLPKEKGSGFDYKIGNREIEVKTARIGINNSFQHENLKNYTNGYFIFVDVSYNNIYLTIMDTNFDFTKKHPILKVKPHLRKDTIDQYKFSLSLCAIKKGIDGGITLNIDSETSPKTVENFVLKFLK